MLIACLLSMLAQSHSLLYQKHIENDQKLIQCVTEVLNTYFVHERDLTYVNMGDDNDELLETIHRTNAFSFLSREPTHQSFVPNQGYVISSENVDTLTIYFKYLLMDPTWNPYAKFLIVIEKLRDNELRSIFDVLLKYHVINVVVVNGADLSLYTYNPFDKHACGKYYNDIIVLGLCKQTTQNLYPNKLVNGLKNCTFKASLAHRPPFSINPSKIDGPKTVLGTEEYIFKLLSEREGFRFISIYNNNPDTYSTITPNMTATGSMSMLQNNETDVIFGGMMMVATRAEAMTYLCGYHDYNDELRFAVKRASLVPIWKTVYIEFDSTVWLLLLLTLIGYGVMMIVLLGARDKGYLMLVLLDNLLAHGRDIRCRMSLKCILLIWVWFAYLINTFYQSSLVSLTTNPSKEHQISDEDDIIQYKLKPCFSPALKLFLSTEIQTSRISQISELEGCNTTFNALKTVSENKDLFSIIPNYAYKYNKQSFTNKWGEPKIYYFEKPYAKFLFGFYFYKGFPISTRLRMNAIRIRENGLADKSLKDLYFARTLKQRFSNKVFEVRFTLPWGVYVTGLVVSTTAFLLEILAKRVRLNWNIPCL